MEKLIGVNKMAKRIVYRQCKLKLGSYTDTAWIPEKFAQKGKYLEIKGKNGWQVVEVGDRMSKDDIKVLEREHLHTREVTDI